MKCAAAGFAAGLLVAIVGQLAASAIEPEVVPLAVDALGLESLREEIVRLREEGCWRESLPAGMTARDRESDGGSQPEASRIAVAAHSPDHEIRRMFSVLFWCLHDGGSELVESLEQRGRSPFEPELLDVVADTCLQLGDVDRRRRDEWQELRRLSGVDLMVHDEHERRVRREEFERQWKPRAAVHEAERSRVLSALNTRLAGA
ncbi:MAG: hypothetical protein ACKVU4_12570 [Phycisphaerales bacterium]